MASTALASAPCLDGGVELGKAVEQSATSWWVAVLILSLLALVLRVFAIDHDSLWFDEAVTCQSFRASALDLITGRVMPDLGNPPLYFVLARAWSTLFGDSEAGLRSFPAFCGILTVPFLAMVGRRLVSRRVGLWGAFLLAISPTAIELSNEARPYALLGLLAVVATWLFRALGGRITAFRTSPSMLSPSFLSVPLTITAERFPWRHAASLAALPRERRRHRSWLGAMAVAGLLGLPVLHILVIQLGIKGNISRMGDRWITQFLATPAVFGFGRNLAWRESPAWMLGAVTLAALVCFWLPALFALSRWRRNPFGVVLLGSWAFIPIIVPLVVAVTLSPIYATRYAVVGLPPFLLLTGWGLEQFRPSIRRAFLVPIVILTSMSLYCYATQPLKDDWRSETRFVLERLSPGELVVFEPDHEIATFLYYIPRYAAAAPEMVALTSGPRRGGPLRRAPLPEWHPVRSEPAGLQGFGLVVVRGLARPLRLDSKNPGPSGDYFVREGLQLIEHRRSHRIEIFHFVREIGSNRSEGGRAA